MLRVLACAFMELPVRLVRRHQDIMRAVEGEPYVQMLSMMLFRSMQQARYSRSTITATRLAAETIILTLPVQFRYPHLLVHRI